MLLCCWYFYYFGSSACQCVQEVLKKLAQQDGERHEREISIFWHDCSISYFTRTNNNKVCTVRTVRLVNMSSPRKYIYIRRIMPKIGAWYARVTLVQIYFCIFLLFNLCTIWSHKELKYVVTFNAPLCTVFQPKRRVSQDPTKNIIKTWSK